MLTSLFELKSPKVSLHSREKVCSFTTNVIFLENKNIKWPKKKKNLWILDASEPNKNIGWSLREKPHPWLSGRAPCSGAGRGGTVSESVCGSTASILSDRRGPPSPTWFWFWEISVLASVDVSLWAYLIFIFCLILNYCFSLCLYPFS